MLKFGIPVFSIISIIFGSALAQGPFLPQATLYEFPGAGGASLSLDTSTYYAELPTFNNKAQSVCLIGV